MKPELTTNSSRPLYEQMMLHLRAAIVTGQYEEGSQLPSEGDLCTLYNVSRITARRAVFELVSEGLLERRQGKGTYVAPRKMSLRVLSIDGFTGLTRSQENSHVHIVRSLERISTPKESTMLGIQPGAMVYELMRVVDISGVPVSMDRSMYDVNRFPGLLKLMNNSVSTYELMANRYHHPNHRFIKDIVLTVARPEEAEYLKCATGEQLYLITKTTFDDQDVANHISFQLVRANLVRLSLSYTRADV